MAAASTKLRLRNLWFQVHKWIGLLLALLIIPISLSGAVLVWHDWLDEHINPARHAVSEGGVSLPPSAYAAAAAKALKPGERLSAIRYPEHHGAPLVATAVSAADATQPRAGPPQRTQIWIDPATGRVLDSAPGNSGVMRAIHILHGSLMVPGIGRTVVGWVGVFMLLSSLTGLWLWWPVTGSVRQGFRWRRQPAFSANLHHLGGFWIALPLAMLSFTGAWISFPAFFGSLSGAQAGPSARPAAAAPLQTPVLGPDAALRLASRYATGSLSSVTWPTENSPEWKIAYDRPGGQAEVTVRDDSAIVMPPRPPQPETIARKMRRWHDGTGMGPVWRTIIFLGGVIPAALAVTGILMWLNTRKWRADVARRKARPKA